VAEGKTTLEEIYRVTGSVEINGAWSCYLQ
jgi:hypothetical protein